MVAANRIAALQVRMPYTAEVMRRIREDRERAARQAWRAGFVCGLLFGALVATMFWVEAG